MKLPDHGMLRVGGPANLVIFRGRKYSELFSRPQIDRVHPLASTKACKADPRLKDLSWTAGDADNG